VPLHLIPNARDRLIVAVGTDKFGNVVPTYDWSPHMTHATQPTFPAGRYGRRREPRRPRPWLTVLLAALTAVVLGVVGLRLYDVFGNDAHTPLLLSESERTDDHVSIRFEVRSRAGAGPAVCVVRARARDGLVVGVADVPVPAGERVRVDYTLLTSARAFVVDIPSCRSA